MNNFKFYKMKNVFLIFFMLWNTTFACTCWGDSAVKKAVKYSDFVFTGKVISLERVSLVPENMHELFVKHNFPYHRENTLV